MGRSCFLLAVLFYIFHFASTDTKGRSPYLFRDEEVCKIPETPKYSKLSCHQVTEERLECKVKCKRGYIHENGNKAETFYCDEFRGGWNVFPLPDCIKKCDPPCENKGKCSSNNHCICTPDYRGKTCQYEVSLCNPSDLGYDSYRYSCNHTSTKSFCILNCPEGMQFVSPPADIYECSLTGTWIPSSAPVCEPLNAIYVNTEPNLPVLNMATEAALSPRSSGECVAWGRFHYRTFDGRIYNFHGPCTYVLTKDCLEHSFSILLSDTPESERYKRKLFIYNGEEYYELECENEEIIMKHQGNVVLIPGIAGTLQLEKVAQYLIITSPLGFRLKWDGKQTVLLSVKDNMKNKTCGLCGQYDGSPSNDFLTISGKVFDHVIAFADSWRMPRPDEKCSPSLRNDYGCTYETTERKAIAEAAHKACSAVYHEDYTACHEILDPKPYFTACEIEVCESKEQSESYKCDTLAEYFRECVRLGGKIHGGWRRENICPLNCPAGMEYTDCGSSCPKTCKHTEYECDNEHCVDGCHCSTGKLLHNGECIPEVQCPCVHGDYEFSPGEKLTDDCNQCECVGGKWECTEKLCNSRCTSTGELHYKTFDGYKYQFKGKCSYYLVYHDNFTISQDNSLCSGDGLSKKSTLCKKFIIIEAYSTNVALKHDLDEVIVNGQDISNFPFENKDIKLQKTSSAILLDIINGVSLTWDGTNNVHIDAPAALIGTIQGLCGTYNHNAKDDFSTPDGAIEAMVNIFAEKWKTNNAECKEVATHELEEPCEMYKEKDDDAHKLCSILKSEIFKDCHSDEDLNPFYKDCIYDICTCKEETKKCLCPVLANYAAACMKKGITIAWRQHIQECEMECTGGQTYQECGNPCKYTCKSLSMKKCEKKCMEGCACSEGTALASDGVCIPIEQCPCFHEEKEYSAGSTRAISGLYSCECINGQWNCNSSNNEMLAHEEESCDPKKNMVYVACAKCPETCQSSFIRQKCNEFPCRTGCSCKEGFLLDTDTGNCMKREDCGCWHGGKRFTEGSSFKRDCNKCNCVKGKWICEQNECSGICSSWGETHFKTFDGHYFDFQGVCEYVLVKGSVNDGNSFQIIIETKVCSTSGIACAKGLKLQLGNEIKLTLSHDEKLPAPHYNSSFIVRKVGLFVFVYTKIGVIIRWDRGTYISIHVDPKWKGKLHGLCGNFNDDQADDFQTPAYGPIEARPRYFGDSWKLNAVCPFPKEIIDICEIHPHRKPWAKKQCSVLKSDLFRSCHKFVPLEPFYEKCVFDTCGCDLGGDCECFCTALTAYSEECAIHGIAIAWRSQDLCPIQCKEDEKYEPCMSTCPKETCETKFMYDDIKKVCNNEPCVEGCDPEPCPIGQIYNNDGEFKCIPEIECEVPCKEINKRLYVEGERIQDYSVVDPCQKCHCQRGEIICTGDPCKITSHCESTRWSQWMNSPSTASGDYERLNDPALQKLYFKFCTPEYIADIQCRRTYNLIPFEHTGQQGICKLPDGLICNDEDQKDGQCHDYEIRILCQCEISISQSTTIPPSIIGECLVPGWSHWMNVKISTHLGDDNIITKVRRYNKFCPENEIEKAECRVSSSKKEGYTFGKENIKCTKNGMQCNTGLKGKRCPDYEIRFYCRCENTKCAYTRGMEAVAGPQGLETRIIEDSQITTKSVLKKGFTEGYHARLNGPHAWIAKTNSRLEWIQVDLGEIQQITAVVTQGNPNIPQWVEKYRVYHSKDGLEFTNIYDDQGNEKIFQGNNDQDTAVTNYLPSVVNARYIRISPYEWNGAISLRLELLGCNVDVVPEMSSTAISPICVPGWTEFFNTDSPMLGDGDYEKIENIVKTFGVCTGGEITDIECKAIIKGERVNYSATGDFGVVCKVATGSYCTNFLQRKRTHCRDYSIRLYCSCEKTTTSYHILPITPTTPLVISAVCGWTSWLNIDKPKSFKGDKGDMESIAVLQKHYGLCQKPDLKHIECRIALTLHDWTKSLQNELRCDTDVGFVCYNRLQAGDCYDYEVRAFCWPDYCQTTTAVPTITSTISTGPCPLDQYYDECAYMCNDTCSDYLYQLHQIGQCQTEEDYCIATCRPYKNCEYPFVWKDPYTCVKKSECSCVTTNGDYIRPGEVVYAECEKCRCFDNIVLCETLPKCKTTPSGGNKISTTTTPSPCPQGEYYDKCAYTCNQTCNDYLYQLHLAGTCQKEGDYCVAACRPYKSCDYPYVWKDPYTCVKRSECKCVLINGDVIYAGEVVRIDCEQCECYENELSCVTDPACRSTSTAQPKVTTMESTQTPFVTSQGFCPGEMTLKYFNIADSQITVSSQARLSGKDRIHLNTLSSDDGTGAWSPKISDKNQYVQIDFNTPQYILGIITQGENAADNWVTKYSISYSINGELWNDVTEGYQTKIFTGNYNSDTPVTNYFQNVIKARYLRIVPVRWHNWIAMRLNVIGCILYVEQTSTTIESTLTTPQDICPEGMMSKYINIPVNQITVSSQGRLSGKDRIYLNTLFSNNGTGAWLPAISDINQYVQIDFGSPQYIIGITTQGENGIDNWVSKYSVSYSFNRELWNDITEGYQTKIFTGNYDSDTSVTKYFQNIIEAKYLRIVPVRWHNWIAMRLGVIGCLHYVISTTPTPQVLGSTRPPPIPKECVEPMVFPSEEIPASLITVSSAESKFSGASRIKIDTTGGFKETGGWKAAINDNKQFVQIDFGENRNLSGIVTQGQEDEDNWVTLYTVQFSTNNIYWKSIKEEETGHEFLGNKDRNKKEFRWFQKNIIARYLKIIPIKFHGAIAMRLEVLGCYLPFETSTTQRVTSPPTAYCPELPAGLRENCPHCTPGYICDGNSCIYPEDCPCFVEGKKYRVGSKIDITSDCQECTCEIHGRIHCEKMECKPCYGNRQSVLTTDCRCECEECINGTRYCPSDNLCIEEYKWCDGKIDCTDDEVDCEYTTTSVIITPSTVQPTCIPTLNRTVATCELNSGFFETFDGKYYQHDICDHVLFREKYLQLYSIEVHKECSEETGQCGRYIIIQFDYYIIKIGPGPNNVEFNGVKVPKTKFHLLSKRFKEFILRNEGIFLTFGSLKYGFEIIWDAHNNVKIKVADCLFRAVNGLCGFYDGIKENDFQKPDGTIAQTVESFTDSWSIGLPDRCSKFICDHYMKLAAIQICSSIEHAASTDCNYVPITEREKEICVASACECLTKNYTATDCTCQILESFQHSCQQSIEIVKEKWRIEFSCIPKCPPGLEWKDCGPACELTCDNFQDKDLACLKKCTPGCFCPPGLVRKEDRCIDPILCHDCVCQGYGDPNYQTFDHQSYAFQGNCTYVLVQHQIRDNHPNLEVYVTNTECPTEPGTTCTTELKLVHNNNVITIIRNKPVRFNQQILEDVVYNFYQDGINITATKEHVMVYIAENNFLAQYIVPNYGFVIKLPSKLYYNETVGLCGICNFEAYDDFYHKNGYITEDVNDFAYSWLVNGSRETCTLAKVLPSIPPIPCNFSRNACEMYEDPGPYIKACLNDVSYSHNVTSSMCNTVLQYASICCEHDVILDDWIKSSGCEFPCPEGMKFQCKSPCQLTCSNYKADSLSCDIPSEYMCSCPENQVIKDGECVDPIYCETCDDEGHKVGDYWNVDLCESCECRSDLKIVCFSKVCPTVPSCPYGTSLQTIDNGTCCYQYECKLEVTECPSPIIPTCPTGAVPVLIKTNACPQYQCECDIGLCQPLRNISDLEPGEEEFTEINGCCLKQVIKCIPEKCPSVKQCGIGSKAVQRKGNCCTLYDCLSLEMCVYKHRFEVLENFRNESTIIENNTKLYKVGEIWTDGLCTTCRCDKESEQFIYSCESEKCVEPSYVTNHDYIYEQQSIPGRCCPEYVRMACQSDGNIYQVGDEWPSNNGDSCVSYKCIIGKNEKIEKIQNIFTCNKSCPAYAQYVESPNSLECCGYCEPFACEEDGKIYMIGEKWIPHHKKCIKAECVKQDGRIEKILTGKQCPLIPVDCPEEHKTTDESGCCELCNIIPGACEVKRIPPEKSLYYFFLDDKVNGACFNTEPIEDLTECSGRCQSESMYSSSLDLFATKCNCCTARESVSRWITLHCKKTNSSIVKEYEQPKVCECTSCSTLNNILKLPNPVK